MEEEEVGFGPSDGFDVLEIAEYSRVENKQDNSNEKVPEDIIKGLRHGCVSVN